MKAFRQLFAGFYAVVEHDLLDPLCVPIQTDGHKIETVM